MNVLAIDPGFDGLGVAVYDADRFDGQDASPAIAAIRCWRASLTITTSPGDPIEARLAEIALEIRATLQQFPPRMVYSEWPAIEGDYGNDGARRPDVNRFFAGVGACLAAVGMVLAHQSLARLELIQADRQKKSERQAELERVAELAGIRLPTGPRGGVTTVEDERDAIWIGWYAMQHRVWRDLRQRTVTT